MVVEERESVRIVTSLARSERRVEQHVGACHRRVPTLVFPVRGVLPFSSLPSPSCACPSPARPLSSHRCSNERLR